MRHIRDEASRMGALVDDLFLLAQLDHERPLRRERVDLAEVARRSAESAGVSAPDRVVEVDASGAVLLEGDPDRLRQVVDNLVVNALTYSTEGAVRVGVSAHEGRAVLTVHDEGPGIDPADLPSIFEPFFRSDPSRARSSGGAGLGLAIVEAIVRAHGGTVTANPGPGATFVVELPAERSDGDELPGDPVAPPAGVPADRNGGQRDASRSTRIGPLDVLVPRDLTAGPLAVIPPSAAEPASERGAESGSRAGGPAQAGMSRIGRLTTLPDRMHEVQAWIRFGVPFTRALTRWTFGSHRRLVRRCEWLTLMPNDGFLPQMSHTAPMTLPAPPRVVRTSLKG